MEKRKFCTQYDLPFKPVLKCEDASLTRQEFVEESNINNIMKRYAAGLGELPHGERQPLFGDFSNVPDYQTSLDIVMDAQDRFMSLPSNIRKEFDNDPAKLLAFIADDANRARAIELGLIDKPADKPAENSVSVPDKGGSGEPTPSSTT